MQPKYEIRAKDRIRKGLQKYAPILTQLAEKGVNEEDTSVLVRDMLADILAYERFQEINAQYKVKGHFVDWAVHIGDELKFFVEVKAINSKLNEKDLFQVVGYTAHKPTLEWAVLTTAAVWQCYRVARGSGAQQFFEVTLLDPAQATAEKVDRLYLLSREAFSRDLLQKDWDQAECYQPACLAAAILSEEVLKGIRKTVKHDHPGKRVEIADLKEAIARGVIRGDVYSAVAEAETKATASRKKKVPSSEAPQSAATQTDPIALAD